MQKSKEQIATELAATTANAITEKELTKAWLWEQVRAANVDKQDERAKKLQLQVAATDDDIKRYTSWLEFLQRQITTS